MKNGDKYIQQYFNRQTQVSINSRWLPAAILDFSEFTKLSLLRILYHMYSLSILFNYSPIILHIFGYGGSFKYDLIKDGCQFKMAAYKKSLKIVFCHEIDIKQTQSKKMVSNIVQQYFKTQIFVHVKIQDGCWLPSWIFQVF